MRYFVEIDGRTLEVNLTGPVPEVDGVPFAELDFGELPGTALHYLRLGANTRTFSISPAGRSGEWRLQIQGRVLEATIADERTRLIRAMSSKSESAARKVVLAPMPGLVVRLLVEPGEAVSAGQGVVVVEAMKMENELRAPMAGTIAGIEVTPGTTVEKGAVLVTLE